jgi:hypothetical protein
MFCYPKIAIIKKSKRVFEGFPSSYCGGINEVTVDAYKTVHVSGILIQFDSVDAQCKYLIYETFIEIV